MFVFTNDYEYEVKVIVIKGVPFRDVDNSITYAIFVKEST